MATFSDGRKWSVAGDAIWTSSDESVLVVNHGNIFVKSEGTATIYGQYTDGTGKVFNTQFTVQSQLFPLTQEGVENFWESTFDEATHTFSGAGEMGWDYTASNPLDGASPRYNIDLQDYQYIVVRRNEPAASNRNALVLFSRIGADLQETSVDLDKMEVVIDLHQLPNIDLTRIEKVAFGVYNSSLSVKEIFLSNDGVNPVRYVKSTTLKASDAAMTYGDEVPQLPYTVSGFANVGTPKLTTTATKTSPVGTYDITVEAGSGADDGIRYLKGRMTVLPAVLTMAPINAEMDEGEEIPSFDIIYSYSGFRNGDTEGTAITTAPKAYTEVTRHAPAGTYEIVATGGEASNYEFCPYFGTLTVREATIVGYDLTAKVGTANTDWHAWGTVETRYAPAVTTKDGRRAQMVDTFEETIESTGELMWQEVTGLPNGDYVVEVFANAVYTPGHGFESSVAEGAEDVAYVEANGQRTYLEARIGVSVPWYGSVPWNGFYRINTTVTDGKLRISMVAEKPGTNWHTIQIKRLVKLPDYTITADSKTMVYGDEIPELTYTTEGWEPEGKPKLTTTATKNSPVGTYPIKVEKGTVTNEKVTYVEGTLTITQAPLKVGVQDVTITEGDVIPSFTLTYSGFRNDDTEANAFTTKPTATTTVTVSLMPGTYPISVSGGESTNYALSYQSGTLTILEDENPTSYRTYPLPLEIFHEWDGCTATSKIVNYDYQGEIHVGEKLPAAELIYGDMGVYYTRYADVTKYNQLLIEGTPGMELRVLLNRLEVGNGSDDDHGGSFTELNPVIGDDGKAIVDLPDFEFVHLNAIKTGWGSPEGVIESLYLVKGKIEKPVTITANDLTMVYGDEVPTLTYSSEGGELNGTPKLSTTATKSSPVGTYPIIVEKGTVTNEKVTYVGGTLTITQAPLTITAKSYTRKQGENNPKWEVTYEGFKNGETEEVLTQKPTIRVAATPTSPAGTYTISVSRAAAENYDIKYVSGKLTVTEAEPVTVMAKSYSRVYGDENPVFEYVSQGAELVGKPEISCEATTTSPVGTYPIVIKKGGVTNYNDTYIDGVLTITKAPLTITAKSYTRKQGENNPKWEVTYEGFKNGETEEVLTQKPTIRVAATPTSPAGTYTISVSRAAAENYDIKYVSGKLTVLEPDGISDAAQQTPYNVRIFSVGGKPRKELQKGVNVVVMSDGTTRKIVIK